jgi:FixJ family two-component response regulator
MTSSWRTRLWSLVGPDRTEIDGDQPANPGTLAQDDGLLPEASVPVVKSEKPTARPAAGISPDANSIPAERGEKTLHSREAGEPVLIVDDDRDWCLECAFSLRQLGYDPLVTHSVVDAMAVFLENDVSIAIVDYNLPESNGITLIHDLTLKAEEQGRSLNFIMATGYATKDIAISAVRASVVDFLEKPITQPQLRAALQRLSGLRPTVPARDALLDKISNLSAELQRLAMLMDEPEPAPKADAGEVSQGEGADVDPSSMNAFIRDQLRREAKRREIGGGDLFGDPTWAMLLDLLLAKIEGRRISVSSACIASGAPMSTALRLVRRLVGEEVLCRLPDEHDRRRHFLVINSKFEQPLLDYVADQISRSKA